MKIGWRLALAGAAVATAVVALWWHWAVDAPEPAPETSVSAAPQPPTEPSFPPVADSRARGVQRAADAVEPPPEPADQLWEAVRRHCPWPPLPSSWEVLGERCLSAMESLDKDGWRWPLTDALDTRRAVVAALANPECGVALADGWPGETRPHLRRSCEAAAMMRLADLQDHCVERLHTDWEVVRVQSKAMVDEISDTQEEYHHLVESDHMAQAYLYWETYLCRTVPPEAFEWIGALPIPPGDPTASRWERPPITQALDLYDGARRLGAEIPDWALEKLEYRAEVRRRQLADNGGDGN